jgi:hypothetical protein
MMELDRDFERMRDYVVGRMPDAERRTFEDRLARDPELVRELEQSLRLREGLQMLKARGYFETRAATAARAARESARRWRPRLLVPALAAAAAAGLALFLWIQPRPSSSPGLLRASLESGLPGAAAQVRAHFTFVSMRTGSSPDLALPTQGLIELRVQPAAHAHVPRFRLTLVRDQEGIREEPLGTLGGLAPANDGYIHLYVDASRLTAGSYWLRVQGETGSDSAAEVFGFRLRALANQAP